MTERYLIVGLGNPGKKYAETRHNIGFMTVDDLAQKYHLNFDAKQSKAEIAQGMIKGKKIVLAKPQTFMNESGRAVRGIADFFKIPVENILVIYDDMDIDLGLLRIRPRGGSGGHNGIKSMQNHLGSSEFARIRFGLSRPPGKMDPAAYVLRPFDEKEKPLMLETMHRAGLAIEIWLTEGIDSAMNQQNGTAEDVAERQRKMAQNNNQSSDAKRPNPNTD